MDKKLCANEGHVSEFIFPVYKFVPFLVYHGCVITLKSSVEKSVSASCFSDRTTVLTLSKIDIETVGKKTLPLSFYINARPHQRGSLFL